MTRVERIGDATLYLADCLDVLPTLPKVDAVITDPPYGIGMDGGKVGKANYERLSSWDSAPVDVSWIPSYGCVAIIFGGNYFALPPSNCWLIWDKETAGITTFADAELAWTNMRGAVRLRRHLWSGPYQKEREERFHPTQKPVGVMRWCIQQAGDVGTVLDPFMGSGTTGVACAQLGRKFIGIEREPEYFDIACRRIEQAYAQGQLFDEPAQKQEQGSLL